MSKAKAFGKFIQTKEKGSKKKESIRQEKKAVRKETEEYFKAKKIEAKLERAQYRGQQAAPRANESTRYKPEEGKGFEGKKYKTFNDKKADGGDERKAPRVVKKDSGDDRKPVISRERKPIADTKRITPSDSKPRPAFEKREGTDSKPRLTIPNRQSTVSKPTETDKKSVVAGKPPTASTRKNAPPESNSPKPGAVIPLNKFLAHSGVSARREAAEIVKSGVVTVNGTVVKEPGFKVSDKDTIKVNGKPVTIRRTMVYILLNKPKDFLTTTEDPEGRKTVMDIVKSATEERVYPIGRLDRNTTGVLLLTNDGELTQKLAHPSYQVKKIYEVKLDKPLVKKDFETILAGITLEDGFIAPDVLAYADPKDKSIIGIEIHSGRNRIVRRIFEHVGYDVRGLDRVMYANLTKKNVDRGKWRFLSEKEVRLLKFLNASYTNTKPKSPTRG